MKIKQNPKATTFSDENTEENSVISTDLKGRHRYPQHVKVITKSEESTHPPKHRDFPQEINFEYCKFKILFFNKILCFI